MANPFTADNRHGKLQDVTGDGQTNFGDTFLGDLLGVDGQAGLQGRSGMAKSMGGARRSREEAVAEVQKQGLPVTEQNVQTVRASPNTGGGKAGPDTQQPVQGPTIPDSVLTGDEIPRDADGNPMPVTSDLGQDGGTTLDAMLESPLLNHNVFFTKVAETFGDNVDAAAAWLDSVDAKVTPKIRQEFLNPLRARLGMEPIPLLQADELGAASGAVGGARNAIDNIGESMTESKNRYVQPDGTSDPLGDWLFAGSDLESQTLPTSTPIGPGPPQTAAPQTAAPVPDGGAAPVTAPQAPAQPAMPQPQGGAPADTGSAPTTVRKYATPQQINDPQAMPNTTPIQQPAPLPTEQINDSGILSDQVQPMFTQGNLVPLPGLSNAQTGDVYAIRDGIPILRYANGGEQRLSQADFEQQTGMPLSQAYTMAQRQMANSAGGV